MRADEIEKETVVLLRASGHFGRRGEVISPEGICPTIRAQSGGNAEPKVLISREPSNGSVVLKAPKAPQGRITVEKGDGVAGAFLHNGQHPYCKGISPTVTCTKNPWVVIEVGE